MSNWIATEWGWQNDVSEIYAGPDGYWLIFWNMKLRKYSFTSEAMDHIITALDVMRHTINGDAE